VLWLGKAMANMTDAVAALSGATDRRRPQRAVRTVQKYRDSWALVV
jgi:hypothetical protein